MTEQRDELIRLDNELMDRLIRGLTVPYPLDDGTTVDIQLSDEGLGFIRGRIGSGEVPKDHSGRFSDEK